MDERRPVTANDFEWSWKRTISPDLAADYAYQFFGIAGASTASSGSSAAGAARGCCATSGSTPTTRRWRAGPPMPKPMELLGLAAGLDVLYAVWESTYQRFDASTGRWSTGPSPEVPRHALQAFVLGGYLYAVGGCTTALQDSQVVERLRLA